MLEPKTTYEGKKKLLVAPIGTTVADGPVLVDRFFHISKQKVKKRENEANLLVHLI